MYIARSHIGKEMVNRSVAAIGAATPLMIVSLLNFPPMAF